MAITHPGIGEPQIQPGDRELTLEQQVSSYMVSCAMVDDALAESSRTDGTTVLTSEQLQTIRVGLGLGDVVKQVVEHTPVASGEQHRAKALELTSSQAAEYLGVSLATVRRWNNAGVLQGARTPGRQRRFSTGELDNFLASLRNNKS